MACDGRTHAINALLRRPALILLAVAAAGCHGEKKSDYHSASKPPKVQVSRPQFRNIIRVVGQPSFLEAYERTSIYPKLTGYIDKWLVDIGDKVNKGDVLARLFVPELVEDFNTKKAVVQLDKERIDLAEKMVDVASADVKAAEARLDEARSILGKYQAEVDRWETEVARMSIQVQRGVVDPQVLLESKNQLKSNISSRDAANATIKKAEAEVLSDRAQLAKSKVDVSVARADLAVASSEEKKLQAWVGYLTLSAAVRRSDRGPQRQHFRLRPALQRRPHRRPPGARPLPLRLGGADLRGRPHRHRAASSWTSPSRRPTTSTSGPGRRSR